MFLYSWPESVRRFCKQFCQGTAHMSKQLRLKLQCGQSGDLTLSQAAAAAAPMSIHWPCKAAARQGQGSGTNLNDRQFNRTSHTQSKCKQLIDH